MSGIASGVLHLRSLPVDLSCACLMHVLLQLATGASNETLHRFTSGTWLELSRVPMLTFCIILHVIPRLLLSAFFSTSHNLLHVLPLRPHYPT